MLAAPMSVLKTSPHRIRHLIWKGSVMRFACGLVATGVLAALSFAPCASAVADEPATISVTLKDHKFDPAEPIAAADKPIVIEVTNQDSTPAEFESKALRVEKVVAGGGKIFVKVRALKPGRYRFFDDYHEATTEGFLVIQ
jgi:hypothetical protein